MGGGGGKGVAVDRPQGQLGRTMQMPGLCVSRFLQLDLSEMEAFVNQHKSKSIKRQVLPFSFYCSVKMCACFLKTM
jgi:hypothetical protein